MLLLVSVGDLVLDTAVQLLADEIDAGSDTPAQITQGRGGSAANVVAVSRRLGRPARFVGALGSDVAGRWLVEQLVELGAEVAGPTVERGPSIVVLIDHAGQRRFLTDRGSTERWQPDAGAWLAGADRLHLTGYALCNELAIDACRELARVAIERAIPISVDPSSTSILQGFGPDRFLALLEEIRPDVLLPNADEARALGDSGALAERVGAMVVVTDGSAPTTLVSPDGAVRRIAVERTVLPVDTTGAGDAFAAGFLQRWDRGAGTDAPLDRAIPAVAAGHDAARRVIGAVGGDAWEAPGP